MVMTGYVLPFAVRFRERALSAGQPAEVAIRRRYAGDGRAFEALVRHVLALAETGALSGSDIPPWSSGLELDRIESDPAGNQRFLFSRANVAEEALCVIAHLLFAAHSRTPVDYLEIGDGAGSSKQLSADLQRHVTTYPARYAHIPFPLDDLEPEGGAYSFHIELQDPLKRAHERWLNHSLGTWIQSILHGGYSLAPLDPMESYIEPDSKVVTSYGNIIECAVFKVRCDPACIDGLVNIFTAFHGRLQPIRSMEIG